VTAPFRVTSAARSRASSRQAIEERRLAQGEAGKNWLVFYPPPGAEAPELALGRRR